MSLEAEQVVVASIIRDERACFDASEKLKPEDFLDERCRLLFELVVKFKDAGRPVDTVILASALTKMSRWIQTGLDDPLDYLTRLDEHTRSFVAVSQYIEIISAASVGRQLMSFCSDIYSLTQDSGMSGDEMIAAVSQMMPNPSDMSGVTTYREAAKEAAELIRRRMAGDMIGIGTGLENLDELILGFEPGTLSIVAGRPSMGKSVLLQGFAHAASKRGRAYISSIEMTPRNWAERAIADLSNSDFGEIRKGRIDHQMQSRIDNTVIAMADMNIYIDDRAGISVDQLCRRVEAMHRKEPLVFLGIDYLQLLHGKGDTENERTGYISRTLKLLAKRLNIPVVCLSQLNRNLEQRSDKRPIMADLRNSGSIEQDADVIVFVYREEVYNPETPRIGMGELICRKNRNGDVGTVHTLFQGRFQRFEAFIGELPPLREPKKKSKGMSSFVGGDSAEAETEGEDYESKEPEF